MSSPAPRDPRSVETRRALVEAAVESLREVGFKGASAREVARRAGCNQAQVFYHFGSVVDLHLAALDHVSERRMAAYAGLVREAESLAELIETARTIMVGDLEAGDLRVLVELMSAGTSVPGLGVEVDRRLQPWFALAEEAVRRVVADLPFGALAPTADAARVVVATVLGLELVTSVSGDRARLLRLFVRAQALAELLDGEPEAAGTSAGPRPTQEEP